MKIKVKCGQCGKEREVFPYRSHAKYCSRECYWESMKNKTRITCPQCSRELEIKPSEKKRGKTFCSRECYLLHYQAKYQIICEFCGKVFSTTKQQYEGGRKYCSQECMGNAIKGERHPNWRGGKSERICKYCGQKFYVDQAKVKKGHGIYCSRECMSSSRGEVERKCINCGNIFFVSQARAKKGFGEYCSAECRPKKRAKLVCAYCGKNFEVYESNVRQGRKYCSNECKNADARRPRPKRKTGQVVHCSNCGQEMYRAKCFVEKSEYFLCSQECRIEWQKRNRVQYTCKVCGKHFSWPPSRAKEYTPRYCSIECRNKDPEKALQLRRMNQLQQQLNPNKLELKGYSILDDVGCEYVPQYMVGRYCTVDALIPQARIAIEFDGDYWHGNPRKYKRLKDVPKNNPDNFQVLNEIQIDNMRLDKSKNSYLQNRGYIVLRFWESDVKENPEGVRLTILDALNEPTQ